LDASAQATENTPLCQRSPLIRNQGARFEDLPPRVIDRLPPWPPPTPSSDRSPVPAPNFQDLVRKSHASDRVKSGAAEKEAQSGRAQNRVWVKTRRFAPREPKSLCCQEHARASSARKKRRRGNRWRPTAPSVVCAG
jgi:hypothetical protein